MLNQWKTLQKMSHTIVRQCARHPPANDFAHMLENIFDAHPSNPTRPSHLTEPNWSLQDLNGAIKRLKMNRALDECGLVAELLHFAPDNVVTALLGIMNQILHTGQYHRLGRKECTRCFQKNEKCTNHHGLPAHCYGQTHV